MKRICVVSVDLRHPPSAYELLRNTLHGLNFYQLQRHLWAGHTESTPARLKDTIRGAVQPGDGVFIFAHNTSDGDYESHNPIRVQS